MNFRKSTVTILRYPLHPGMKRSSSSGSTSSRQTLPVQALVKAFSSFPPMQCFFFLFLPREDSLVQGAQRKNKRRMMCHARYPETPNAPILGAPSSICKEVFGSEFATSVVLSVHVEVVDLQIRDDHHSMNRKSHEYPRR